MSCNDSSLNDTANGGETSSRGFWHDELLSGVTFASYLHSNASWKRNILHCFTLQGLGRFRCPPSRQRRIRSPINCQRSVSGKWAAIFTEIINIGTSSTKKITVSYIMYNIWWEGHLNFNFISYLIFCNILQYIVLFNILINSDYIISSGINKLFWLWFWFISNWIFVITTTCLQ